MVSNSYDMNIRQKKGNRPVYYKALAQHVEVNEESRTVSGYLASFNTVDDERDMIIKGAFAKSLQEHGVNSTSPRKIAYLYQHNSTLPLGKFTKLEEDEKGLYFEAEIDRIPLGDQVLTQYQSGTLNQHSIGFRYVWDKLEYDEENDVFVVKEAKLFEGSVVTMGMNENTPFLGMKSADIESQQNQLNRDTEALCKSLDDEQAYKVRQLISKHIALAETEPGKPIQEHEPPKPKIDFNKLSTLI